MPHPLDASIKHLVTEWLADWLPLSGRRADGPVEVVDADLSTVTAAADKVLRVRADAPWLLHLELQSYRDPGLAGRAHFYNALLEYRHGLPVWSVVVLLCRQADHATLTGTFERGFPGEAPYRSFRYQVVRVWQTPPEVFLNGGLGTLPLAPLGAVRRRAVPALLGRMNERLRREATPAVQGECWAATGVLMGMRFPNDWITEQIQMAVNINWEENSFYKGIIAKGMAQGMAQGMAEGRADEARKLLLRLGRTRLGPPASHVEAALASLTDLGRLEMLADRLLLVSSWEELLAAP